MGLISVLFKEIVHRNQSIRTPEPDLIMTGNQNVQEFYHAGSEAGEMAPTYLIHSAQICQIIRPGDTVVDLACGPCNQLGQLAKLNPDIDFIGVDLSTEMLEQAEKHINSLGLKNITLLESDITKLENFHDSSIDVVISTMSLHHLPDYQRLANTMKEISRILKKDGGIYLADFGRLKLDSSMRFFAYKDPETKSDLYTLDFYNSLRAAFSVQDFVEAKKHLPPDLVELSTTFLIPFLVIIKTLPRRKFDEKLYKLFFELKSALNQNQARDCKDLLLFTKLGGIRSPYL